MSMQRDSACVVPSVDFRAEYRNATLSNNFMFRLVMEKPELCRKLLERVLDIRITDIKYPDCEVSLEARLASKGVRLDVYVTDEDGVSYDIEMQVDDRKKPALGKRTRYYQSQIDIDGLKKGQPYSSLGKSIIIFICTFDPFDRGFARYNFSNICHQDKSLEMNDEAYKVFINTYGDRHKVSKALGNLMDYINTGNPDDEFTEQLEDEVKIKRDDTGLEAAYMTYSQTIMEERALARAEGRAEGKAEGRAEGRAEGKAEERVANVKAMIKVGLTNFAAVKNSGLYTAKELEAIAAP